MKAMPTTKNHASVARLQLLRQISQRLRRPFTDRYRRLIAGAEVQTAAATMAAPNTVHTYTSVTVEKPLARIFLTMQRRAIEAYHQQF